MRQISDAFAARLAAGVTSLCACWRLTRVDGQVFGATDHDSLIVVGGVTYEPAHGLTGATFESTTSLAPGRAAAGGALSADFITEDDLAAGLWDGARVDVFRVDWEAPEHRVLVWSGRLSEVTQTGVGFQAELVSLKADLERPVGRVYGRKCDAEVGDARCTVDLTAEAFRGDGVVTAVHSTKTFAASGLDDFSGCWFQGGVVSWATGANAGVRARVARHLAGEAAEIELAAPPRFAVAVGDTFEVTAGCDKGFATCGAKFANQDNFRGFPHMAGTDAVIAGPSADQANDGGSRAS